MTWTDSSLTSFQASFPAASSFWNTAAAMAESDIYGRIWRVVQRIPAGRVATYGQIAALVGRPGHARQVGYALHNLPEESDVPWHRVINAQGRVSPRASPGWDGLQRMLLLEENVIFGADGCIDLERYRWEPDVHAKLG